MILICFNEPQILQLCYPCFGHCLSPLFKQTWFSASRSYLNQLVAYSLLEHLIISCANMLSLFWHTVWVHYYYLNKLGSVPAGLIWTNLLLILSLLEHLIISCVFKYFRSIWKLERVYSPPGAQPEISSKEGWEKHTIFGRKHTLFGRQEGGGAYQGP